MEIFNPSGKMIGHIIGDTAYLFKRPEHFMIKYQGFGMSESVIDQIEKAGINRIVFIYTGRDRTYFESSIKAFKNSIFRHTFNENDNQSFVPLSNMREFNPKDEEEEKEKANKANQNLKSSAPASPQPASTPCQVSSKYRPFDTEEQLRNSHKDSSEFHQG